MFTFLVRAIALGVLHDAVVDDDDDDEEKMRKCRQCTDDVNTKRLQTVRVVMN